MTKLIDLHIHTTSSDGDVEPIELFNKIKKSKLIRCFSYTDHDNVQACKEMCGIDTGDISFINGVEFSSKPSFDKYGSRLHILGYDIDLFNEKLNDLIKIKRKNMLYNFELLLDELFYRYNMSFTDEEITEITSKNQFGRVDLAKLMIKNDYVADVNIAFESYLMDVYEAVRSRRKMTSEEQVIDAIHQANGFVSLAHPISLKLDLAELDAYVKHLKEIGLDSIEVQHIYHTEKFRKQLKNLVDKYNLLESGGTDFHGLSVKPNVELATGINGNIKIKQLSLLNEISKRK